MGLKSPADKPAKKKTEKKAVASNKPKKTKKKTA